MSILKLFGFTAEAQLSLFLKVKAEQWEEGQAEELSTPRPDSEVWVVCVSVAEKFMNAVFRLPPKDRLPKAVLWVPQGKKPLPLADWWEGFHAQLREESEEDISFLEKVSRCARVLDWGERVEDIPAKWFAFLTGSPRPYSVDALPFNEEEKQHLSKCADCREEAYERLQWRAEMRWMMLCPEVSEIAEWLEAGEDPQLEAHVSNCGLCRETVKRQAWLWEGAGLLTAEQVNAKLAAVGIAEPAVEQGIAGAWLEATLDWLHEQAQTAVSWAALLAAVLCRRTALRPALRTARASAEETGVSMEDLNAYLTAGEPVTLWGKEQWLHLMVEGDAVRLRAGKSPADRFEQFRVEFRRGKEVVVAVSAANGVALLTPEHFQNAKLQQADQLVIIV